MGVFSRPSFPSGTSFSLVTVVVVDIIAFFCLPVLFVILSLSLFLLLLVLAAGIFSTDLHLTLRNTSLPDTIADF